ncbi:MAG TPA: hypothetical protein VGX24_12145 [Pyrinomonadaceae bacterium]|jgi:hypothetical protein|nr:hypothetical protein [Pyrinomonadaceae bacterium]
MQIKFRLYAADPDDRPPVEWLAQFPLPSPDVKEVIKAAGFDPAAPDLYSFGRLSEQWGAHEAGCLVVTKNRKLPEGEPLAVSLKPL